MDEEGDFMAYSRVKKYQELRDGIKEEAGIDREKVIDNIIDDEDDDFLSFIKKDVEFEKPVNIEDTLTEPKTFEQMRQEGSKELEEALRDAKKGVGKDNPYNTRMDILSKIRDGEKTTIKIDSVDEYSTDEFARGMFINEKTDTQQAAQSVQEESVKEEEPKKKMTLMEKLASISPEEDAKKAQEFLQKEMEKENSEDVQSVETEPVAEEEPYEETDEIEKVLEETKEYQQIESDDQMYRTVNERKEENVKKDGKIVKVLDVIITVLVMILIILLCIIIYQNFF